MDVISNLGLGFAVALTIQNIAYCFIGVLLGTIIGVLPGIGPVTTVAMLLPISFTLQPESALILLAGPHRVPCDEWERLFHLLLPCDAAGGSQCR